MRRLASFTSGLAVSFVLSSTLLGCADHAQHAVALYEKGDYAAAARAADDGLASHPDDDGLWGMRVRAALAQGDADGLAKAYGTYRDKRGEDDKELLRDLAIATLGQALASPSAKLKIAAIDAVQSAELEALAEQVAEQMESKDDKVAASAAVAVLNAYPQAPDLASQMMKSEDAEARRIAVDGVARKLHKKMGKLLQDDLETAALDKDARVRRVAARWLGEIKDQNAVEVLTKQLKKDPDDSVRAAAATALARIGIGNLESLGSDALKDKSLAVRIAAIDLVAAANRPDRLQQIAQTAEPMVAVEAAIAIKDRTLAEAALQKAASADDWTIRAGAANVASRALGKDGGVAFARTLLADKQLGVRLAAARVLAHGGDKQTAAGVFAEALATPDLELQAAEDLAEQGDDRGVKQLDADVRDSTRTAEQRAAAASAHYAAHRVTPGLVAALADANAVVRVEAAGALAMLAK